MRKLPTIAAILALLIMPGMAAAQQSPSQAQAAGKALGAASLQSGRLTPAESNRASQGTGSSNVWGGAYTGSPDSKLTAKQSETSMIGIGNKAINESVSSFQGYNTSRDDQASQATYFLNKNPVLKPTVSSDETWVKAPHGGIGEPVFASDSDKDCKQVDVRTPLDPNETYSCLETYKPYVVPCDKDISVSYVSVPKPDIPAGIGSYYCPAGGILSGSTCNFTTTTTSPANTSYTCSAGGVLNGTNCIYSGAYSATPNYLCPGGATISGNLCVITGAYAATAEVFCPSSGPVYQLAMVHNDMPRMCMTIAYPKYDQQCEYNKSMTPMTFWMSRFNGGAQDPSYSCIFYPAQRYSCPLGGTLQGNMCATSSSVAADFTGYTCPSGGTLSGSTCLTSSTSPATVNQSCYNGGILGGSTCSVTTTQNTSAIPNYYCPSGYVVTGSMCTGAVQDNMNTSELSGCGALEGLSQ